MSDSTLITASMRAFMSDLVDYAGLFPPAKLPLLEAIENYGRYRLESNAWMLARFIIPVGRLAEITDVSGDRFQSDHPYRFSILGTGGADSPSFLKSIESDLEVISTFRQAHGDRVIAEFYEVRLPISVVSRGDVMEMSGMLATAGNLLAENGLRPFFEGGLGASWRNMVADTVWAIASYNKASGQAVGFKLRCGGLDAASIPTQYQVANVIVACRDAGVPLKFTAGLHHPIRQYDDSIQTRIHGFVNVFGAGILAHGLNLFEHEIAAIISDENPSHFIFDDLKFTWHDRIVSTKKIQAIRQENMISFGSCSFGEPIEGLQMLDWLVNTGFIL